MIYIQKRRTPDVIRRRAEEIKRAPENGYADIKLPEDSRKLRSLFDQMNKNDISKALRAEQHGLCAFCMSRLKGQENDSIRIEHYKALSADKETALDYHNFLGVCDGGEKETAKPHVLCCDAARKERKLTINPWDRRQMQAIAYKRNGDIFVRTDSGLNEDLTVKMQEDIDNVLMLNGKKHKDRILDTSTGLRAKRKGTYESVCTQFDRWARKKCLTPDFLKEKIDELERQISENEKVLEFIGVRLYFYKRKYNKLLKL